MFHLHGNGLCLTAQTNILNEIPNDDHELIQKNIVQETKKKMNKYETLSSKNTLCALDDVFLDETSPCLFIIF